MEYNDLLCKGISIILLHYVRTLQASNWQKTGRKRKTPTNRVCKCLILR